MHPAAIGPFQILRELGRGGMGVVYLANDTKLDRPVAIKALPEDLSADSDRLARFQREAKILASLSHANIGGIYGLESADGHQYLVLEFIEGETLGDRLTCGAIAVEEALTLARQIAEALEVAHEKGIVHRDLKPGNVMITPEGVVKVLDFGIARVPEASATTLNIQASADSPAVTTPARALSPTIPGAIMGTAGYMSPEQARGKAVDKRSDIFSFGCVLYEMLTGVMPFRGETVADAIGATLHKELDFNLLPPRTPVRVRELLASCLTKDRKNRLHDIGDARLEIERAISGREWALAANAGAAAGKRSRLVIGAVGCGAAIFAGAAGWLLASSFTSPAPRAPPQSFHLSTATPAKPGLSFVAGIAPDARFVIYRAWTDPEPDSIKPQGVLVVRRLDRDETKIIEGTEGARDAALSPDGRWLAFAAAKDRTRSKFNLKKIALDNGRPSGAPETLCELPAGGSPALCWSSDREIVMALRWNETILAVSAAGGEPRVILREERGKEFDFWDEIRPLVAGRSILATRSLLAGQTLKERTEIVDLVSGKRTPLLQNAGGTQLTSDGYLIAKRNTNTLIAARFDVDTLQMIGEPVTIWNGGAINNFWVSRNGTLAMLTASGDISGRKLARIDEQGQPQIMAAPPRPYGDIAVSPDGGRIAMYLDPTDPKELSTDLWVYDLTRRTFTRLPSQGPSWDSAWSHDGQRITYNIVGKNEVAIWERRTDGSGEPVKMHASEGTQTDLSPKSWSPDGTVLAFMRLDVTNLSADVWMLEQDAGTLKWIAKPYLDSPAGEGNLFFSPDGKWVRFASDESGGRRELYVQRFTGAGSGGDDAKAGRVQISTGGSANGFGWWSPDGKEIRYLDPDGQVMSVQVQTEPSFSASIPKVLYSIKDLKIRTRAFAPDGQLIVVLEGENERANSIGVVVNFLDEVRAKMEPAK